MLKSISWSGQVNPTGPDYLELVEFLVGPLLESPDGFSIDCEQVNNNQRIWIRLAFEEMDKGRVFGRGGRNLQAIRTVLQTAAIAAGQSLYLDIYESQDSQVRQNRSSRYGTERKFVRKKTRTHRPPTPRLSMRSRWES